MPYRANLAGYLGKTGMEKTTAFLTWGQIAGLPVLFLVLPFFLNKVDIKWTISIGVGCYFNQIVGETGGFDEWNQFSMLPVVYLFVIFVLFIILFRDKKSDEIVNELYKL